MTPPLHPGNPSACKAPAPFFSIHHAAIYRFLSYPPHLHRRPLSVFVEISSTSPDPVTPEGHTCQLVESMDYKNMQTSSPIPMIDRIDYIATRYPLVKTPRHALAAGGGGEGKRLRFSIVL